MLEVSYGRSGTDRSSISRERKSFINSSHKIGEAAVVLTVLLLIVIVDNEKVAVVVEGVVVIVAVAVSVMTGVVDARVVAVVGFVNH